MNEDKKITILCYGDSNTYGYSPVTEKRWPSDQRWTGILQSMLGPDYKVIEEGCNGRTTVFPDPDEPWKCGLTGVRMVMNTHKPIDIVILMLGSNDLKDYFHASAEMIADGAEQIVEEMQTFSRAKFEKEPEIILVSPIEIGAGIAQSCFADHFDETAITRSKQFPALYETVARRRSVHFFKASDYGYPSKEDCLHMMPEAHEKLAEGLCGKIMEIRSCITD